MPEPEIIKLYGKELTWGSPELEDYIKKYYGEDFVKELEAWKTGKSEVPPRPGWDYLLKQEARPADARETQMLIDRYKVDRDAGKYRQTPTPTPVPTAPSTLGDSRSWLQKILGG